MTRTEARTEATAALAAYRRARADYARTARDPHSLRHAAAAIGCADAAERYMAARMMARSATAAR